MCGVMPGHVRDGHTVARLEHASINNQVLLLIITWPVWQGTLAVGRVKGRLLVGSSGLGENVQLWTSLNTKTDLPGARGLRLASQRMRRVGSVPQPYSWGTAEPLAHSFCVSDLILHYKVVISVSGRLHFWKAGAPFPWGFWYRWPVICNLGVNEVMYDLINVFVWRHTELWSPWTSVC